MRRVWAVLGVIVLLGAGVAFAQSGLPRPVKTRAYAPNRVGPQPDVPAPAPKDESVRLSPDTASVPPQQASNPVIQPSAPVATSTKAAGATQTPVVMSVRIGEHEDRTRFVIELSDPVKLRVFTLANPNRVVIDMPQMLWRLNGPQKPSGNGAIKSYRYGLFRPGNSRFVIDLNMPVTASEPMILPPSDGYGYRVVLDLYPVSQEKFEDKAGWPADLQAKETVAEAVAT